MSPSDQRRELARRVAAAHTALGELRTMALVSGSVVEDIADEQSDVDMSIAFAALPAESVLQAACAAAGGLPWHWQSGLLSEGSLVVAFKLEQIEVQIAYCDHARLDRDLSQILVAHEPDTPVHKLAEGLLKAEPLKGEAELAALKLRLASFPPELGRAMAAHFMGQVTPWRAISQLVDRDASLWCRELQVQTGYRLLGALSGLNDLYYTSFQLKRMRRLASKFRLAPKDFADRLERTLMLAAPAAFSELHALEGEVLRLIAKRWPDLDFDAVHERRKAFASIDGCHMRRRES